MNFSHTDFYEVIVHLNSSVGSKNYLSAISDYFRKGTYSLTFEFKIQSTLDSDWNSSFMITEIIVKNGLNHEIINVTSDYTTNVYYSNDFETIRTSSTSKIPLSGDGFELFIGLLVMISLIIHKKRSCK